MKPVINGKQRQEMRWKGFQGECMVFSTEALLYCFSTVMWVFWKRFFWAELLEFGISSSLCRASLVAQMVKTLPAMQETWVWSLGWEDPLEEGITTPVFLPGESPWTEEPGGLQFMGSQRVRQDWLTKHSQSLYWSEIGEKIHFKGWFSERDL